MHNHSRPFLILFVIFSSLYASAQITGVVTESETGKPVKGAKVFINKFLISNISNASGEFSLSGIAPGFVELIIYKKGFKIFRSPIRVKASLSFKLQLKLIQEEPPKSLEDKDNAWKENVSKLYKTFVGTEDQKLIKIINAEQVRFSEKNNLLMVSFHEPLILDNYSLGYRISCYQDAGEVEAGSLIKNTILSFDTLKAKDQKVANEWVLKKDASFSGSKRHFFSALALHHLEDQGFSMENEKGIRMTEDSVVSAVVVSGYSVVKFRSKTRINHFIKGVSRDEAISWLVAKEDLAISPEGMLLNDASVVITGAMQVSGLLNLLPNDFVPVISASQHKESAEIAKHLQEKVYMHVDKPYYYPGEAMWFKGYINYFDQQLRDSLSKVLYVELISPGQKVILTRSLRIDSGTVHGDFVIPDLLKSGNYQLRAYTNLMRNFDPDNFFTSTIPVLNPTDKVDPVSGHTTKVQTDTLMITTDKPEYKLRERIKVNFTAKDKHAWNVSVSVTDVQQVVPLPHSSLPARFTFNAEPKFVLPKSIDFLVEKGVSFTGQYLNDRGKKDKSVITVIQGAFQNIFTTPTNAEGLFHETGFQFYDTMQFSFQGQSQKDKPQGKITIMPHQSPAIMFKDTVISLKIIPTGIRQRIISEYEVPRGATVLKEVSVSGNRINKDSFISAKYGTPSRVFNGTKFTGSDILSNLTGLIPGLQVALVRDPGGMGMINTLKFSGSDRPGGLGVATPKPMEPLIYINGVFRGGGLVGGGAGAISAVQSIDPKLIDYVEVIDNHSRSLLIANEGGSGLISFKTRPSMSSNYSQWKVPGYYMSRSFKEPPYDEPGVDVSGKDYRATLYWHPNVIIPQSTGASTVTFHASDLPGKYRVVVEGVSSSGEIIHREAYFEVKE